MSFENTERAKLLLPWHSPGTPLVQNFWHNWVGLILAKEVIWLEVLFPVS